MRKGWLWLLVFFLGGVGGVLAADLDQTSVRMERMVSGESPLPVLVVVKTKTAAVENWLKITVGSGWTVENNVSVSTVGLPNGVIAWPGIGNSTGRDGQTITFPSSDLISGMTYGFYIVSGLGNNPAAENYTWTVTTNDDSASINVSTVANDQVVLTGRVGAKATDFQLEMTADKTGQLTEGEEISYQITYGSYLPSLVKPLIISAEWDRGTISGSPLPSVEIADYVVGSGTSAWGGISPVVDLVNRKITWTINSFPANTVYQTVEFKLRVNESYSGRSEVTFKTKAYLNGAGVVTVSREIDNVYHPIELTPTPSATPTLAPTSASSSTTTTSTSTTVNTTSSVSGPITAIKMEKVDIARLTESEVGIRIKNNVGPETIKIWYGLSIGSMTKTITSINKLVEEVVEIFGLKSGTNYFFKIETSDSQGNIFKSEIYTFRTAEVRSDLEIDKKSLLVSAGDNILLDAKIENKDLNAVVMITNQEYSLKLNLNKPEEVKTIKILIKNEQVLGISSVYGAEPNSIEVNLVEINKAGFVGHLVSPKDEGYYEIVARIEDKKGNILEDKIGEMRVIPPLVVVNDQGRAIENAKVEFYRLNPDLKIYELIGKEVFGMQNPSFTDYSGRILANLAGGSYRVKVSEVGYSDREVDFTLGWGKEEKMPVVVLTRAKTGWWRWLGYYAKVVGDTYNFSKKYVSELTTSQRFFKLSRLGTVVSLIITGWLLIAKKGKIYWWQLPTKLITMIKDKFRKSDREILKGKVVMATTKMPIKGAEVYLTDIKLNKVLSKVETDKLGEFRLIIKPADGYRLAAVKENFEPTPMLDFTDEGIRAGKIEMVMREVLSAGEKSRNLTARMFLVVGKGVWLIWLWGLMWLQLIFWKNFGLATTWWGVALAGLSLAMWLMLILEKDELEKI